MNLEITDQQRESLRTIKKQVPIELKHEIDSKPQTKRQRNNVTTKTKLDKVQIKKQFQSYQTNQKPTAPLLPR
jgi:hypothetical protein